MKKLLGLYCLLATTLWLVACGSTAGQGSETVVAIPTQEVAAVTDTPEPTATSEPTATAVPSTDTPEPTETTAPTETAVPPTEEPAATEETADAEEPEATPTTAKPKATATPEKEVPTAQPLAGGDEIDGLQLMLDSEERASHLETSQFTQNVVVAATGFEQQITQNCQMELPDHAYCHSDITLIAGGGEPFTTSNETVQDGDQTWLREEGGEWQNVTTDIADSDVISQEGLQQLKMSEFMADAEVVGETTIDGVLVYELAFSLDVNAYVASILGEEMADLFTSSADENSGNGRTWIGQDDRLVRKAIVEMSFVIQGEAVSITTQLAAFGFNEPVDIPDPTVE